MSLCLCLVQCLRDSIQCSKYWLIESSDDTILVSCIIIRCRDFIITRIGHGLAVKLGVSLKLTCVTFSSMKRLK